MSEDTDSEDRSDSEFEVGSDSDGSGGCRSDPDESDADDWGEFAGFRSDEAADDDELCGWFSEDAIQRASVEQLVSDAAGLFD